MNVQIARTSDRAIDALCDQLAGVNVTRPCNPCVETLNLAVDIDATRALHVQIQALLLDALEHDITTAPHVDIRCQRLSNEHGGAADVPPLRKLRFCPAVEAEPPPTERNRCRSS